VPALQAHQQLRRKTLPVRQAAWYQKPQPTCSDAVALVHRQIWRQECFSIAKPHTDDPKLVSRMQNRLSSAFCYMP
jgi:hypothetical protein